MFHILVLLTVTVKHKHSVLPPLEDPCEKQPRQQGLDAFRGQSHMQLSSAVALQLRMGS